MMLGEANMVEFVLGQQLLINSPTIYCCALTRNARSYAPRLYASGYGMRQRGSAKQLWPNETTPPSRIQSQRPVQYTRLPCTSSSQVLLGTHRSMLEIVADRLPHTWRIQHTCLQSLRAQPPGIICNAHLMRGLASLLVRRRYHAGAHAAFRRGIMLRKLLPSRLPSDFQKPPNEPGGCRKHSV
ncbi:hypothetical protein BC628DRAFT_776095 [Trametes gibbosa]|nr:hypothetical protein BC628DRAFT_776095 [Trametes gibbosa]